MRKLLLVLTLALGGCAQQLQELKTVYTTATGIAVTPAALIAVANSFDVAQALASDYLVYCKSNLTTSPCSADNRRQVIKYVRSARAARNQAESYIVQNANAPGVVYTTLVAAINGLSTTPAAKGANQ